MIRTIINRVCKSLDISVLYESETGIKCLNNISVKTPHRYLASGGTQSFSTENLYMCMDRLKDPYTLLYTNLLDSPHFELMQILRDGGDVMRSAYVQRLIRGTLDSRSPISVDRHYIQALRNTFQDKISAVQDGTYAPVQIIRVAGQWFIGDGRHRAALCAVEKVSLKCIDISPVVYDTFNWWCYRKMLKARGNYKKHIQFFESVMAKNDSS